MDQSQLVAEVNALRKFVQELSSLMPEMQESKTLQLAAFQKMQKKISELQGSLDNILEESQQVIDELQFQQTRNYNLRVSNQELRRLIRENPPNANARLANLYDDDSEVREIRNANWNSDRRLTVAGTSEENSFENTNTNANGPQRRATVSGGKPKKPRATKKKPTPKKK